MRRINDGPWVDSARLVRCAGTGAPGERAGNPPGACPGEPLPDTVTASKPWRAAVTATGTLVTPSRHPPRPGPSGGRRPSNSAIAPPSIA